jgi:hypothetical protein
MFVCLLKFTKTALAGLLMVVLLLIHATGVAQKPVQPKLDLKWIFITRPLVWKAPSRDPELPKYESASAEIMVFYPTGEYATASFWIGRYKRDEIFIIPGEGFAVRKGHWRHDGNRVTVTSQLANSQGVAILPSTRNSTIQETFTASGISHGRLCARLIGRPRGYVPLRGLENFSTFESILGESK